MQLPPGGCCQDHVSNMRIYNYGEMLSHKVLLRLNDKEKDFISTMSQKYNIKETQYIRILIDWFLTHIDEFDNLND